MNVKGEILKIDDKDEGLSVSLWENEFIGMSKSKRFDKSRLTYFICQKTSHFMEDCTKRQNTEDFIKVDVALDRDSFDSVCAQWSIDTWCSYHM